MASVVGRPRGCLAAAAHAFSVAFAALHERFRRTLTDGRRRDPRVGWTRRELGGVALLRCEVDPAPGREAEARLAVAAAVAEVVAGLGLTVGSVGVVPGEEPRLVALAPRRDVVAPRVLDALAGHATSPPRHLWLALAPGTYLASVVDPYRAFEGSEGEVAATVRAGLAACALTTDLARSVGEVRLVLGIYCSRSELRNVLSLARNGLEGVRDRLAAR